MAKKKIHLLFKEFFESEKSGGLILIACTIISLIIANSSFSEGYEHLLHLPIAGNTLTHWINDGLMTIFFLLIGLELEREVYVGELSNIKNAILPVVAALGGMVVPAGVFLLLNYGTPAQSGAGIPMATDIAFALGILSLLGKRVPTSLKIFLTALAVIDDLGAILIIAFFYTSTLSWTYLSAAGGIFALLLVCNRLKIHHFLPYLIGGVAMWYCMLHSGVHATITGVLVAFAIPFGKDGENTLSYRLQHFLHKPVAFFILPVFALANTAIVISGNFFDVFKGIPQIGIMAGLFIGKPVGILLFSVIAVALGLCAIPSDLTKKHLLGAGILGGIGFTMSIFITLLAYNDIQIIDASKLAILTSSLLSAIVGLFFLKIVLKKQPIVSEE
ncbi:MAG: Na+/H+ antiporter NhaA [Chitinophagaceae bacterium]